MKGTSGEEEEIYLRNWSNLSCLFQATEHT